jgi:hypothetical protein
VLPVVSLCFPFLHGDEMGTTMLWALLFRSHVRDEAHLVTSSWRRA